MIKGFKEFIAQGNALELAVAVIIGAAFKPIVDAITKVIMTIIGQLIGQPQLRLPGGILAVPERQLHLPPSHRSGACRQP